MIVFALEISDGVLGFPLDLSRSAEGANLDISFITFSLQSKKLYTAHYTHTTTNYLYNRYKMAEEDESASTGSKTESFWTTVVISW